MIWYKCLHCFHTEHFPYLQLTTSKKNNNQNRLNSATADAMQIADGVLELHKTENHRHRSIHHIGFSEITKFPKNS